MRHTKLVFALLGFAATLVAADPTVGTWKLNTAKSKYSPGPAPTSATITYEDTADGIKRTGENVLPDGTKLSGPASLRDVLAPKTDQLAQCMVEKMLVYSLGRGVNKNDQRNVADIMEAWKEKEYRLESLIYIMAHSLPFQSRRNETVQDGGAKSAPSQGKPSEKSPSGKAP